MQTALRSDHVGGRTPPGEVRIASITYRSRANRTFNWADLDALTRTAQQRNRPAQLTGILLYEEGHFFQTIEGPPAALEPVWDSIRHDPRHREVDVLSMRIGDRRMHAGWDMRWLRKGDVAGGSGPGLDFLEPAAPSLRYATLALDDDDGALRSEIDRRHPRAGLAALLDHVIEPTARALGDAAWRDDIEELALFSSLARLNAVMHDRALREGHVAPVGKQVLCAAWPGEPHLLATISAAEIYRTAGWQVDLAFPETAEALLRRARTTRYDRIDIGTSDAAVRADARADAPALAQRLRAASANPDVELSFGGRAFWTDGAKPDVDRCTYRSSAAAVRR